MHFIFVVVIVVMFRALAHPFCKCIYFIYFSENILSYLFLTLSLQHFPNIHTLLLHERKIRFQLPSPMLYLDQLYVFFLLSDANIVITFNSCSLFFPPLSMSFLFIYLFIHLLSFYLWTWIKIERENKENKANMKFFGCFVFEFWKYALVVQSDTEMALSRLSTTLRLNNIYLESKKNVL